MKRGRSSCTPKGGFEAMLLLAGLIPWDKGVQSLAFTGAEVTLSSRYTRRCMLDPQCPKSVLSVEV
jgi:hypothetical protein